MEIEVPHIVVIEKIRIVKLAKDLHAGSSDELAHFFGIRNLVKIRNQKIIAFLRLREAFHQFISLIVLVPPRAVSRGKLLDLQVNNPIRERSESAAVLLEVERLRLSRMRLARLDQHKPVDHVLQNVQPDFQQIQLVEKAKAIVNHLVVLYQNLMTALELTRTKTAPRTTKERRSGILSASEQKQLRGRPTNEHDSIAVKSFLDKSCRFASDRFFLEAERIPLLHSYECFSMTDCPEWEPCSALCKTETFSLMQNFQHLL